MNEKVNKFDVTEETYKSVSNKLPSLEEAISKKTAFLGFDGIIDYLYSLAKSRKDCFSWQKMESMEELAELIVNIAGSSTNIEMILKRKVSGGFTSNVSKAMCELGVMINLIGAYGFPNIDEVFQNFLKNKKINLKSIINPGLTVGLEFDDGKIMLTDFENLLNINWELIIQRVGSEEIINYCNISDIIGIGYWAPMPNFERVWMGLIDQIFPSTNDLKKKIFLVDLADIKKKNKQDILNMVDVIKKLNDIIPVVLSLNDQEAKDICRAMDGIKDIDTKKNKLDSFVEAGRQINKELNLSFLVIHSPYFATISTPEEHFLVTEGFTSQPCYTTSAGDHFNAGMAIGLSCNLSPAESILLGNAITAIFVRTGFSPNFDHLSLFIRDYMKYINNDIPTFPLKE